MRRGEIWTVSGASDYAGKPRPSLVLQDDNFADIDSITICGFTTEAGVATMFRLPVEPSGENGLFRRCNIMVDKITTVPRTKLGNRIGMLAEQDLERLNRAIIVFLGLTTAESN